MWFTLQNDKIKSTENFVNPANWMLVTNQKVWAANAASNNLMPGNLEEYLQRQKTKDQEKGLGVIFTSITDYYKTDKVMYNLLTLISKLTLTLST